VGYTCLPFATIALRRRQRADLSHCASSKPNEIAAHFIWMHVAIVAVTRGLFAAEAVKFRVKVVCTQRDQWQMQRLKKWSKLKL
jgi:hypothetical protein